MHYTPQLGILRTTRPGHGSERYRNHERHQPRLVQHGEAGAGPRARPSDHLDAALHAGARAGHVSGQLLDGVELTPRLLGRVVSRTACSAALRAGEAAASPEAKVEGGEPPRRTLSDCPISATPAPGPPETISHPASASPPNYSRTRCSRAQEDDDRVGSSDPSALPGALYHATPLPIHQWEALLVLATHRSEGESREFWTACCGR